jgi:hypothetical protein
MGLLESIDGPRDLDGLTNAQLVELAAEIRAFLVANVSKTGGHLGPNLGVVELTIAMHRVFQSPHDAMVFDTGHQRFARRAGSPATRNAESQSTTSSRAHTRRARSRGQTASLARSP